MRVQFELMIGENKFTLIEDVENNADFFKKLAFYSTLPKVGPNGETDLVIQHRVAQKQYDYYSIVSKKAGMEFKFGQSKDAKGGLFAKGWEPLYKGDQESEESNNQNNQSAPVSAFTGFGGGAQVANTAQPAAQPAAQQSAPQLAAVNPQVQTQVDAVMNKFGLKR